jgi:cytochrome P450
MSGSAYDAAPPAPPHFDPLQLYDDPYPLYRRLREEAPLYYSRERDCWVVSRYEDVSAVARDWETYTSTEGDDLDDTTMLFAPAGETAHADPPTHTRLRGAVQSEFRVKAVREMLTPAVRARVLRLIEEIRQYEEVDFVKQLALPLPGGAVCAWLGFAEEDHERLLGWWRAMAERSPGQIELPATAYTARDAMRAQVRDAILERSSRPRQDLLTAFAAAVSAGQLSEDEALGMTTQLFFAGIATTSALIGNSLLNLSDFEDQLRQLQRAPEQIPAGVEELLRFDPPVQWLTRVTTREVELYGTTLPVGARVLMLWAAANRDEARCPSSPVLRRGDPSLPRRRAGSTRGNCALRGVAAATERLRDTRARPAPVRPGHAHACELTCPRYLALAQRTDPSLPARVRSDAVAVASTVPSSFSDTP